MKSLLACLLIILPVYSFAKEGIEDPKAIIAGKAPDTAKVKAYHRLSKLSTNIDSAFYFAETGLKLAREIKYTSGEAACLNQLGGILFGTAHFPESLSNQLKALELYEKLDDIKGMIKVRGDIANIYSRQENFEKAVEYIRSVIVLKRKVGEDERAVYFGLGKAHEFNKDLDSALIYYQRCYEYLLTNPSKERIPFVLIHLGNVHLKQKNYMLALSYARMAASALGNIKDSVGISSVYTHIAEIFHETDQRDSAVYYAEKAFGVGTRNKAIDGVIDPALLLAKLYENDDKKAYFYFKTAKIFQDSIFSVKKLNEISVLSFKENERQRELNESRLLEEETRKNNMQYAAIAAGLLTFLIFFLLISNSIIVNEKLVRFLGVLSLLMVFEFLNLLLHPYVAEFTHHSPILLLLAMVVIAACLIPTHHKLEKWITQKMVQKNKKARVTVAKKILEKHALEEQN
jgi:tetratricopeptide (TPR) repeat protein